MVWLGDYHFESTHPNARLTIHSLEMQADIIEICMAAFRENSDFANVFAGLSIPDIQALSEALSLASFYIQQQGT